MHAWFKSNLILMLLIAPIIGCLTVNSVERIASFGLYKLAKPTLIASQKPANDLAYDVKARAAEAKEIADASLDLAQ
jgi:hypothetical protein